MTDFYTSQEGWAEAAFWTKAQSLVLILKSFRNFKVSLDCFINGKIPRWFSQLLFVSIFQKRRVETFIYSLIVTLQLMILDQGVG